MLSVVVVVTGSLCVLVTAGSAHSLEDTLERGTVSLNEMFREVEMLMEDTQQILDEAVDQVFGIYFIF